MALPGRGNEGKASLEIGEAAAARRLAEAGALAPPVAGACCPEGGGGSRGGRNLPSAPRELPTAGAAALASRRDFGSGGFGGSGAGAHGGGSSTEAGTQPRLPAGSGVRVRRTSA
mmetsp:Transcript_112812/g.313613  ORF Transcript_112812/g.313613 Transcript_112812/m.313613 type:complete len:115 (+) Transcript_112812:570-914(+)